MKTLLVSDIVIKTRELLNMNDIEPVYDFALRGTDNPKTLDNIMARQEKLIAEMKEIAKAKNTLLGRTMRFPMADSYALYVVTNIIGNTVTIKWVKWCDAWMDDRLGDVGSLSLKYVSKRITGEDKIDAMFNKKKAQV